MSESEEQVRARHDLAAMDPRAGADVAALADQPPAKAKAAEPPEDKPAPKAAAKGEPEARPAAKEK